MPPKSQSSRRFRQLIVLLACYWLTIFTLTHMPITSSAGLLRARMIPHADKLVHFAIYGGLAFLLTWFFRSGGRELGGAIRWTMMLIVVYGALDEGLQNLIPSRRADLYDFVADVVGGMSGVVAFVILRSVLRRRKRELRPRPLASAESRLSV